MCCTFVAVFWIFIYCFLASKITALLEMFEDVANQSVWYKYPIELRKAIIFINCLTQKQNHFHGFGLLYCNMQTFASVSITNNKYCDEIIIVNFLNISLKNVHFTDCAISLQLLLVTSQFQQAINHFKHLKK